MTYSSTSGSITPRIIMVSLFQAYKIKIVYTPVQCDTLLGLVSGVQDQHKWIPGPLPHAPKETKFSFSRLAI